MDEQRFLPDHGEKAGDHPHGAGKEEAVDEPGVRGRFPDREKEDEDHNPGDANGPVMPHTTPQITCP